jgi:hypothetical protein
MVGDYLNESYEDDLVESIFEEVSEETWEAIEEAILNELSPKTLKSYIKKAEKDKISKSNKLDKQRTSLDKVDDKVNNKNDYTWHQHLGNLDKQRKAKQNYSDALSKSITTDTKRNKGIARATDSLAK